MISTINTYTSNYMCWVTIIADRRTPKTIFTLNISLCLVSWYRKKEQKMSQKFHLSSVIILVAVGNSFQHSIVKRSDTEGKFGWHSQKINPI